jgi:A/G-specific adenine glycosylase
MTFAAESSDVLFAPLASWFDEARRDLPWRDGNLDRPHPNPYAVLVSELMLQQTQVATVVPYFQRWMARFPDVASLAAAPEDEVHKHWEGLGYYRRARHLQAAAKAITQGGWPVDLTGLADLPGLGPYTSAALASIAFQLPEPALDGNGFRVLSRLHAEPHPRARAEAYRAWLRPALEQLGPSRITQALMELGAVLCLPKSPRCGECPLAGRCRGFASGDPARFPTPVPRAAPRIAELWLVAVEAEGGFLLECPRPSGLLAGLWRWPTVEDELPQFQAAEADDAFSCLDCSAFPGWTQVYTHRREVVHPLRLRLPSRCAAPPGRAWIAAEELDGLPLGSRDQRLRSMLQGTGIPPLDPPPPGRLLAKILA